MAFSLDTLYNVEIKMTACEFTRNMNHNVQNALVCITLLGSLSSVLKVLEVLKLEKLCSVTPKKKS